MNSSLDQFADYLKAAIKALERLFEDPGLLRTRARFPYHPAVRRLNGAAYVAEHGAVPYPEEATLLGVAELVFDQMSWLGADDGRRAQFIAPAALARMRSVAANPNAFNDMTSQLYVAGRLRDSGITATAVELDGRADVLIETPHGGQWVEVKRIHLGTSDRRAAKDVSKANRQLTRASGAASGALVLFADRHGARASTDDRIPTDVRGYADSLRSALAPGKNTHTAAVYLVWDDFLVSGAPPDQSFISVRRRVQRIDHPAPLPAPQPWPGRDVFAAAMFTSLHWPALNGNEDILPVDTGHIRTTDMFKWCVQNLGVRASLAIETLEEPDALERISGPDSSLVLAVRSIDHVPFGEALLVLAAERQETCEILGAFRVRVRRSESVAPLTYLRDLLESSGLRVHIGDTEGLFIEHASVEVRPNEPLVHGEQADGKGAVFFVMRVNDGDPRTADFSWVFSISVNRYRAALNPGAAKGARADA